METKLIRIHMERETKLDRIYVNRREIKLSRIHVNKREIKLGRIYVGGRLSLTEFT